MESTCSKSLKENFQEKYIYIHVHINKYNNMYIYTEYPDYLQNFIFLLGSRFTTPKNFGCYIWKSWEILLVQYQAYHISSSDIGFITINSFL